MNLVEEAEAVAGFGTARAATAADAVDGISPMAVVGPPSAERVAATLAWAARERLSVVPRGRGTKLGWGPASGPIDLLLSTARLNQVVAHRHGDLTATVQAGAPLASVNAELARHGQWLPLDPAFADRATIGGIVATNDAGPRRHRYGAPRDLIIGIELARADGRVAKGGGIVVKNVAGYDVPRLLTGSFGSLAVIVSATFKLYPLTSASRTLVAELASTRELAAATTAFLASPLMPTALDVSAPPLRLLVRFESIRASVDQQSAAATRVLGAHASRVGALEGDEEAALWASHAQQVVREGDARLKVAVVPTEIAGLLDAIERTAPAGAWAVAGRAGLGVVYVSIGGGIDVQLQVVDTLRALVPPGRGSVVVVAATPELKRAVDVWGPIGDGLPLMRAVKRQFDPAGILSPGRGPGGL